MLGATNLRDNNPLRKIVKTQASEGRLFAAICAAPAVALGQWGLLKGLKVICLPWFLITPDCGVFQLLITNYVKLLFCRQLVIHLLWSSYHHMLPQWNHESGRMEILLLAVAQEPLWSILLHWWSSCLGKRNLMKFLDHWFVF